MDVLELDKMDLKDQLASAMEQLQQQGAALPPVLSAGCEGGAHAHAAPAAAAAVHVATPHAQSHSPSGQQLPGLQPPARALRPGSRPKVPPILQLDPCLLLPGRDSELGFGQRDLRDAVYDFGEQVRDTVSLLAQHNTQGALTRLPYCISAAT